MTDIIEIHSAAAERNNIMLTGHAAEQIKERQIRISEIYSVLDYGIKIEDYPTDYPYPSCLMLGLSEQGPLHVVCSLNDGIVYLITAYRPDPEKWEADFRTRRRDKT